MNRVDVLVPCYNYGRFLERCVQSILTQQDVHVRVLIIDDTSTDDTPRVGEKLARRDPRVEFRRHPVNKGHIATYNEGLLDWASSEYSMLLSADDMLAPGALARAAHVMDRHADVGMTYGMALVIRGDDEGGATGGGGPIDYRIVPGTAFLRRCFETGNAVETPTAVVRTAVQHRLGGYRPELPHSGDMEMWMRFAAVGSVGVVRSVQGYVRKHGANMSDRYYGQQLRDRVEIVQACEQILAQWGARFPEAGAWRAAMRTRIGDESCRSASRAFDEGDLEAFHACLDFAESIHPARYVSSQWWRATAKKRIGRALWTSVRPLWTGLRQVRQTTASASLPAQAPHLSGWWPDAL